MTSPPQPQGSGFRAGKPASPNGLNEGTWAEVVLRRDRSPGEGSRGPAEHGEAGGPLSSQARSRRMKVPPPSLQGAPSSSRLNLMTSR